MPGTSASSPTRSPLGPIAVVCVVLLALGGAYVGGYFVRTDATDDYTIPSGERERRFKTIWERTFWMPMIAVESRVIGMPVTPTGPTVWGVESIDMSGGFTWITRSDGTTIDLHASPLDWPLLSSDASFTLVGDQPPSPAAPDGPTPDAP